jgi:hypothetical protein
MHLAAVDTVRVAQAQDLFGRRDELRRARCRKPALHIVPQHTTLPVLFTAHAPNSDMPILDGISEIQDFDGGGARIARAVAELAVKVGTPAHDSAGPHSRAGLPRLVRSDAVTDNLIGRTPRFCTSTGTAVSPANSSLP